MWDRETYAEIKDAKKICFYREIIGNFYLLFNFFSIFFKVYFKHIILKGNKETGRKCVSGSNRYKFKFHITDEILYKFTKLLKFPDL